MSITTTAGATRMTNDEEVVARTALASAIEVGMSLPRLLMCVAEVGMREQCGACWQSGYEAAIADSLDGESDGGGGRP